MLVHRLQHAVIAAADAQMIFEGLTMRIASTGLTEEEAMANELSHGLRSLSEVQAGLERFRAGAGRHGAFE